MPCLNSTRCCTATSRPTFLRFVPDHGTFQNSLKTKFSPLKVKISHNLKALVVWVLVKTDIFKHSFVLFLKFRFVCWLWGSSLSSMQSSLHRLRYNTRRFSLNTFKVWSYWKCCSTVFVQGEDNVEVQSVFAVCLQAQLVPASVHDYREKLLHLRKLRHDLVPRSLPRGPPGTIQQVGRRAVMKAWQDE